MISHELNNSLAPIASLANTAGELLRRGQPERLPQALETIAQRSRHLEGFIRDYARFAKLPAPRREAVPWSRLLTSLASQMPFTWQGEHHDDLVRVDVAQLEQALLNLLKNAHESGSDAASIHLHVRRLPNGWRVDIADRGSGIAKPSSPKRCCRFTPPNATALA